MRLGWVGKWLDSIWYGNKIVHERVSQSLLRVTMQWTVGRYIAEHVEQFVATGEIDPNYRPVIDQAVLAEIEAERAAAEAEKAAAAELERELARQRKEEAEAAERQCKKDEEIAKAERKQKLLGYNCRRILIESMRKDDGVYEGSFDCLDKAPQTIRIVRDYLTTTFPEMFAVTYEGESVLQGTVSSSLL